MEKNVRSIDCGGTIGKIKYKILNPGGNQTALIKGNEYITIESLDKLVEQYKQIINELCF